MGESHPESWCGLTRLWREDYGATGAGGTQGCGGPAKGPAVRDACAEAGGAVWAEQV